MNSILAEAGQFPTPPIVVLCGSTRFRAEMAEMNRRHTLAGAIVLAPGVFAHDGDEITEEQKEALDNLHFRKIDLADLVYVVDPGGYIDDSTREEIRYARRTGKPITRLSQETSTAREALIELHEYDETVFGGFYCTHCTPEDDVDLTPWPCPSLRAVGMDDGEGNAIINTCRAKIEEAAKAASDASWRSLVAHQEVLSATLRVGSATVQLLADVPRDFDGLAAWMADTDFEGIVWHHPDGTHDPASVKAYRPEEATQSDHSSTPVSPAPPLDQTTPRNRHGE